MKQHTCMCIFKPYTPGNTCMDRCHSEVSTQVIHGSFWSFCSRLNKMGKKLPLTEISHVQLGYRRTMIRSDIVPERAYSV